MTDQSAFPWARLAALEESVATVTTRVDDAESDIAANTASIATVSTAQADHETRITNLETP